MEKQVYQFNNTSLIIDLQGITFGDKEIKWIEVTDFSFAERYFNGKGGLNFSVNDCNQKIQIVENTSFIFGKAKRKKIEELRQVVFNIIPYMSTGFIRNTVAKIKIDGDVKISKIHFLKNGVKMKPRTSFWTKEIDIPYDSVLLLIDKYKMGLVGEAGTAPYLTLVDTRSEKEFRYSNNATYQPPYGDMLKAKILLNYIKENGL